VRAARPSRTLSRINGFKVEGVYSDVAGTPFNPESPEITIVCGK